MAEALKALSLAAFVAWASFAMAVLALITRSPDAVGLLDLLFALVALCLASSVAIVWRYRSRTKPLVSVVVQIGMLAIGAVAWLIVFAASGG
jgi:hypothetical protein